MKLNLLKNAGKVLGFTETPSLSSYLKKQSNPLLKATGKTLYFLDFFIDDETPDYLKQSNDNYWDDDELSAKQSHDMDSNTSV